MTALRTIFMGTPDFAVPSLAVLCEQTSVAAVVTRPDKRKGRGLKLLPSPVKKFALERNIPVYQPEKAKDPEFIAKLADLAPDLIVVVAFGQILPKSILTLPKYGAINVHASLLPRWRGAAPMQRSIINGDTKTGVTTMFMDEGLDTGDMLLKTEVAISEDMLLPQLHDALAKAGAKTLGETLCALVEGRLTRQKQNDAESCYAPMIKKETGLIDWQKSAREIHNLVRGLNSFSPAYTFLNGARIKIHRSRMTKEGSSSETGGEILRADKNGLFVSTGDGVLEIAELQAEGKRQMSAAAFLSGCKISLPARFSCEE